MKTDKQMLWIQILALAGLVLAVKLAFIYYSANYDQYALPSFCSISEFIDCDGAAKSSASQFLGIPLAYWGIFFYLTVLFLTFVDKLKNKLKFLEVFKAPKAYITVLGVISFVCSMILACVSIFSIKKLCILCFITYFIDLAIAIIAAGKDYKNLLASFKVTVVDFIDGAKKYTKTFIVLLILAVSFFTYSGVTLNFVPKVKQMKSIMKYRKIEYNPYRVKGNTLGNESGDVVVELYSDYVCPLCYINNIMLHQAVKEFKNIKVVHYNYPFDRECNPNLSETMHKNACFMSQGALAAKKQGNYWEMSSLLYENQPKTFDDMLKLAEQLGFDKQKFMDDFYSPQIKAELAQDIKTGGKLDIDATPTMIVNGEKVVGVKPYYELKDLLVKHGAKK